MKSIEELSQLIEQITSKDSPVGMNAVYVHALILDKLETMGRRIENIEKQLADIQK